MNPFVFDHGTKGGLAMLKYRMGDVYREVIRMMLSGDIPKTWMPAKGSKRTDRPDALHIAIRQLGRCVI